MQKDGKTTLLTCSRCTLEIIEKDNLLKWQPLRFSIVAFQSLFDMWLCDFDAFDAHNPGACRNISLTVISN